MLTCTLQSIQSNYTPLPLPPFGGFEHSAAPLENCCDAGTSVAAQCVPGAAAGFDCGDFRCRPYTVAPFFKWLPEDVDVDIVCVSVENHSGAVPQSVCAAIVDTINGIRDVQVTLRFNEDVFAQVEVRYRRKNLASKINYSRLIACVIDTQIDCSAE